MTEKRIFLALTALALLAACGEEPADEGAAAQGEVLEGTISDAMLPLDRVQSEAPLEDPEAFEKAQGEAARGAGGTARASEADATDEEEGEVSGPEQIEVPTLDAD